MTFPRNADYLQDPPHIERQSTRQDVDFATQLMMRELLTSIKDELCMQNPRVLCETQVQGGNILTDTESHTIRFLAGGKPVTVYKVIYWGSSVPRLSVVGMSASGNDGFAAGSTLSTLHLPISEMSIALNSAGTVGVNQSYDQNDDGAIFIYGFTTENYMKEQDY